MVLELLSEEAQNKLVDELIDFIRAAKKTAETETKEKGRWMNQKEACAHIKVSPGTFKKLRESGKIKPSHIDGFSVNRYDRELLDRFMERNQL